LYGRRTTKRIRNIKKKVDDGASAKIPGLHARIHRDASAYAIGTVLSQGKVGDDRPIAYASRVLSRAEQNYSTTEKELLAIVWAVKRFRPYIYGTKFKDVTDHKPLI